MTLTAAEIYRKYEIPGMPASGSHKPDKAEIIAWATLIESLLGSTAGGLAYASQAALFADLAHPGNLTAIVFADPAPANNGTYRKVGSSGVGSWTRIGDLPSGIVRLTVTGGSGNAIVANAPETPSSPGSKLYLMTPTAANTGATTIAVNAAAAVPIKSALGATLAANALLADSQVLMAWSVDHYQILISTPVDASGVLTDALAAASASATSATAAASSASALANQVHQYDTRAQAIAATIPTGVKNIVIIREAAGYPRSEAPYIPGTSTGPRAFQEAGGHWWELDLAGQVINVLWFGAVTLDPSADQYAIITAAWNYAKQFARTLGFPEGTFAFSQTLNFAYQAARIVALSPHVTLSFTGTGRAITFDGITYNTSGNGIYSCEFGGEYGFDIKGNANCTDLVYVNNFHYSHMKFRGRDCTGAILKGDKLLLGTPTGAGSAVASVFDVQVSGTADQLVFTTQPARGIDMDSATDCIFKRPVVEGCGAGGVPAVRFTNCAGCNIEGGTVESNPAGGLLEDSACVRMTYTGVHNEVNGSGPDWDLRGSEGTLIGCHGRATTGGALNLTGDRYGFEGCQLDGVTLTSTADNNEFKRCDLSGGTVTDGGTNTRFSQCASVDDTGSANVVVANGAHGTLIPTGDGAYRISIIESAVTGDKADFFTTKTSHVVTTLFKNGHWADSTTTPGAGTFSLAWDSVAGQYAVYNNEGSSCRFKARWSKVD